MYSPTLRSKSRHDTPMTIFYAFKQSEAGRLTIEGELFDVASTGWEKMLEGLAQIWAEL